MNTATSQFISVRETAQLLVVSEKKVMDLIEERKLRAYKIADKFLRLKKNEVLVLRNSGFISKDHQQIGYAPAEKLFDFLYFSDFYIFSAVIILVLLFIIFYT